MRRETSIGPAYRVETGRLQIRCWAPTDAPLAQRVMARSDAHLRRFIPFTQDTARTLDEMLQWLREHRAHFDRDEHYRYALFERSRGALLGEAMLLDREQRGDREIGYWVDEPECTKGYATEGAGAMVALAFELDGVDEVTLYCSPKNQGSVTVAGKLGFEHTSTRKRSDPVGPDDLESMCWRLSRDGYAGSLAARMELRAFDALDRELMSRTATG